MTPPSRRTPPPGPLVQQAMRALLLALAWLTWAGAGWAQAPAPAPAAAAPAATPAGTAAQPEAPQPVAIADIAVQAEAATQALRDAQADLNTVDVATSAMQQLPPLRRRIELHEGEVRRALARNPTLETIRGLQPGWTDLDNQVAVLTRELTRRATRLDRLIADVTRIGETWEATRKAAAEAAAPAEVIERAAEVSELARKARAELTARRARILALQTRAADLSARIGEVRTLLRQASDRAVTRLFERDSPPIWSAQLWSGQAERFALDSQETFAERVEELLAYWEEASYRIAAHVALTALLVAGAYWLRARMGGWVTAEPRLGRAARVFERPVATGVLLGLLGSGWVYGAAPRLIWALLGAIGTVPTVTIVRRIVDRHLVPVVYAVVTFYLLDRLRTVIAPSAIVSRVLFMCETVGAIVFLLWLHRSFQRRAAAPAASPEQPVPPAPHRRNARRVARAGVALLGAALLLSAVGLVRLANVIGSTALVSAYTALVLYAAAHVIDGLVMGALRVRPLASLRIARLHGERIARRVGRVVRAAAVLLWAVITIDYLALSRPLQDAAATVLQASVPIGDSQISVGQVVAFGLALWATVLLSRLVRFILEEEVFPSLNLARGLPYAISAMVRYAILILGGVVGLAALGVDMTKFTILAGALSVGLGFGLQNIVNNFVSGLIVLFERPVKVGDTIQLGDVNGQVERIGIRASVIRTANGAEVIVPNGKLISDQVTNWTFTSQLRRLDIPVLTAATVSPAQVADLLTETARQHAGVVESPLPEALLNKLGADSYEFELRAWTSDVEHWTRVRSELVSAVGDALRQAQIAVR